MRPLSEPSAELEAAFFGRDIEDLKRRFNTGMFPAEHTKVWTPDGTSNMKTLVATPNVILRGYRLSNSSPTTGLWVAFYNLEDPADIDDDVVPDDAVRIPPKLTANESGAGIDGFQNGLCFALWTSLDDGSPYPDIDFDGTPAAGTATISLQWDGPAAA